MRIAGLFVLLLVFSCTTKPETLFVTDTLPYWISNQPVSFQIQASDSAAYNIHLNLRNDTSYPWARFFGAYVLRDSAGNRIDSLMVQDFLFDPVTGEPKGVSGLGDVYNHEILIRKGYRFPYDGTFRITLQQMMRADSLQGIRSAGIRLETPVPSNGN